MWNHFTKFVNDECENKARCNYCDREFYANSKLNGITSLKNHMVSGQKFSRASDDCTQPKLAFQLGGDGSLGCH